MILVDTDVLIEFRRGKPEAVRWISGHEFAIPVPGIVAMEMIAGSQNKSQLDQSKRFVAQLDVQWHDEADNQLAFELVQKHCLSTGLSLQDFLIAAQAINRQATLLTFNLKHFQAIPGLSVERPYER